MHVLSLCMYSMHHYPHAKYTDHYQIKLAPQVYYREKKLHTLLYKKQ